MCPVQLRAALWLQISCTVLCEQWLLLLRHVIMLCRLHRPSCCLAVYRLPSSVAASIDVDMCNKHVTTALTCPHPHRRSATAGGEHRLHCGLHLPELSLCVHEGASVQ